MSLFTGVDTAKSGGPQFPKCGLGKHKIKIERVEGKKYFSGKGTSVVTTFTVLESGNAADPVGATREHFQDINAFSLGDIKNWASACMGVDPRDKVRVEAEVAPVVVAACDEACSEKQLFAGVELIMEVYSKPNKKDPSKPAFLAAAFYPVPAAT